MVNTPFLLSSLCEKGIKNLYKCFKFKLNRFRTKTSRDGVRNGTFKHVIQFRIGFGNSHQLNNMTKELIKCVGHRLSCYIGRAHFAPQGSHFTQGIKPEDQLRTPFFALLAVEIILDVCFYCFCIDCCNIWNSEVSN